MSGFSKIKTHTNHHGINFYIREFGALRIFLLVKTYHLDIAPTFPGITFLKKIWLTIHNTSYYSPSVVNTGHPSTPIQGLIGPLFNLLNIRTQDMFNTTYWVYQNDWSSFEVDYIHKYGEQNYKY